MSEKRVSEMTGAEIQALAGARGKTVRITVDLSADDYAALNRWVASAAVEASPDARRISLAAAVRAMIHAVTLDKSIGLVVVDLLRRERS